MPEGTFSNVAPHSQIIKLVCLNFTCSRVIYFYLQNIISMNKISRIFCFAEIPGTGPAV